MSTLTVAMLAMLGIAVSVIGVLWNVGRLASTPHVMTVSRTRYTKRTGAWTLLGIIGLVVVLITAAVGLV